MFKLEDDVGFLLARTHRAMRRAVMSRVEPLGITYPQFQVLNTLCEEDNIPQIVLAERVNMDKTSLARMLERMEKAGLIQRRGDPEDSRVNLVMLRRKGRNLQSRVTPLRNSTMSKAVQGLSEKEVERLKQMLNQIYDNACSYEPHA